MARRLGWFRSILLQVRIMGKGFDLRLSAAYHPERVGRAYLAGFDPNAVPTGQWRQAALVPSDSHQTGRKIATSAYNLDQDLWTLILGPIRVE